jgi:hypothetical protein
VSRNDLKAFENSSLFWQMEAASGIGCWHGIGQCLEMQNIMFAPFIHCQGLLIAAALKIGGTFCIANVTKLKRRLQTRHDPFYNAARCWGVATRRPVDRRDVVTAKL